MKSRVNIEHNKKLLYVILFLLLVFIAVIFIFVQGNQKSIEGECHIDTDCVPSTCCHSESCVPIGEAPVCDDIFCTQVCSGPLDCNAGICGCVAKKCSVISNE